MLLFKNFFAPKNQNKWKYLEVLQGEGNTSIVEWAA